MISFPLYYIAIPFLVLVGVWLIFAFFNIYHTLKFGYVDYISYVFTFFFLGATIITLYIAFILLIDINWYLAINF